MGLGRYFKHIVDIVYVVITAGVRSTTTVSDVPAFITQQTVVIKDESGDHLGTRHIVFLKGDVVLDEIDELIVDDKQRPIVSIFRARTRSKVVHHLEVEVQ